MYGAILGDIAGSLYEFSKPSGFNYNTVELFSGLSRFTDDTVLTLATKYALLEKIPYKRAYSMFAKRYPKAGYGNMFLNWVGDSSHKPYNSYGNGSAMRVSYVAEYFNTLEEVETEAERSSAVTHNHKDGIRAARAVAGAIFLARQGESKEKIAKYVSKSGYTTKKPLFMYRPFSKFDATANASVPLAIRCFLESDDWESCIRNVFSVKCDTDTIACIAGALADAFYKGTGFNEDELLRKYLIIPDKYGFDSFLYDCASCKNEKKIEEDKNDS